MKVKAFVHFNACIEIELDERYAALATEEFWTDPRIERLASDCATDAELKLCDLLPANVFDIEVFSVGDDQENILVEY